MMVTLFVVSFYKELGMKSKLISNWKHPKEENEKEIVSQKKSPENKNKEQNKINSKIKKNEKNQ